MNPKQVSHLLLIATVWALLACPILPTPTPEPTPTPWPTGTPTVTPMRTPTPVPTLPSYCIRVPQYSFVQVEIKKLHPNAAVSRFGMVMFCVPFVEEEQRYTGCFLLGEAGWELLFTKPLGEGETPEPQEEQAEPKPMREARQ